MDITKKITIKDFVAEYNKRGTEALKDKYLKDTVKYISYLPFVTKVSLADSLVNISVYKQEKYIDESGNTKSRKTDEVEINSTVQYLLFVRIVIDNYTNLKSETPGFFEEYDLLKSSGILDKLIGDNGILPMNDIAEFRNIVNMKQNDVVYNEGSIQASVARQVGRVSDLVKITFSPIVSAIEKKIDDIPKEDIDMIIELAKNGGLNEV